MTKPKEINLKPGAYLYIEDDENTDLIYFIKEGKISFESTNHECALYNKSAGPGDVAGFISSLSNRPRISSAIAQVETTCIGFHRNDLIQLLQYKSDIAFKILNTCAAELGYYNNIILKDTSSEDMQASDLSLFQIGQYYYDRGMLNHSLHIFNRFSKIFPKSDLANKAESMIIKLRAEFTTSLIEPVQDGMYTRYSNDQIIFFEHEPGNTLYVIHQGKVKILKYSQDAEVMIALLGEGEIFGELAIISDMPRNATAISYGETVLLPVSSEALDELLKQSPDLLRKIMTSICKRIWFTFVRADTLYYTKPITRLYVFLENKLLEQGISKNSNHTIYFHFGIEELLKMNGYSQNTIGKAIDELLNDNNLSFQFNQTTVCNPHEVILRSQFFRSRDHLKKSEDQ